MTFVRYPFASRVFVFFSVLFSLLGLSPIQAEAYSNYEARDLTNRLYFWSSRFESDVRMAYGNSNDSRERTLADRTDAFNQKIHEFKSNVDRNFSRLNYQFFMSLYRTPRTRYREVQNAIRYMRNLAPAVSQSYGQVALTIQEIESLREDGGDSSFVVEAQRLVVALETGSQNFFYIARSNSANNYNSQNAIREFGKLANDTNRFKSNIFGYGDRLTRNQLAGLFRAVADQFQYASRFLDGLQGTEVVRSSYTNLQNVMYQIELLSRDGTPINDGRGHFKNVQRLLISSAPNRHYRVTGTFLGNDQVCTVELALGQQFNVVDRRQMNSGGLFSFDIQLNSGQGSHVIYYLNARDCNGTLMGAFQNNLP